MFLETLFIIKFLIKTQEIKCNIHKTMDFSVKKKAENDKKYFLCDISEIDEQNPRADRCQSSADVSVIKQ